VAEGLDAVLAAVENFLLELLDRPATLQQAQERRDVHQLFQRQGPQWLALSRAALDGLLGRFEQTRAPAAPLAAASRAAELSLVGEETVETQILAARAALAALDKGGSAFNDLRLRLQHLERGEELVKADPVHALNLMQALVHAWLEAGFTREQWLLCQSVLQSALATAVAEAYRVANDSLYDQGVLPEIDLRGLVRRAPVPPARGGAVPSPEPAAAEAPVMPSAAASGVPVAADVQGRLLRFLSERLPQAAAWLQGRSEPGPGAAPVLATTAPAGASPSQAETLTASQLQGASAPAIDWSSLEQGAAAVRAQVRALKAAARSDQEKAVIELVALIFDAILTEERIPSSIRVWFARLQMPVLRMALGDPSFLASEQHPARQLIDRMGVCVLGFDPELSLEPLEKEIRRIVQVIEQYPDTGRRVFELMHQEFLAFLAQYLRAQGGGERLASMAQQLEQRETLTVRYTIELRKMLEGAAVGEAVRDFLFQTWTEVMAQAAVRYGAHDERALRLRQAAADLLWAAGAKASRQERAQVIAKVPALLARLRDGMVLLGQEPARQDALLKQISDALAQAFLSRAQPLDQDWLAGLTRQLAALEDVLTEGEVGDLELDRDSLELITGVDASDITVLPRTDAPVRPEMRARAAGLEPGAWFELEHNGLVSQVQLVWTSEHRQFYLFVAQARHSYLLQQGRVAVYLQAGLLRPQAAEGLTARATRDALEKLDANPERLLA
jgi:hypothetical protein